VSLQLKDISDLLETKEPLVYLDEKTQEAIVCLVQYKRACAAALCSQPLRACYDRIQDGHDTVPFKDFQELMLQANDWHVCDVDSTFGDLEQFELRTVRVKDKDNDAHALVLSFGSEDCATRDVALIDDTLSDNSSAVAVDSDSVNSTAGTIVGSVYVAKDVPSFVDVEVDARDFEVDATRHDTLYGDMFGHKNIAMGIHALASNTTGGDNVALGNEVLKDNTTGSNNAASGYQALYSNTGSDNIAFGYQAGYNLTTGDDNICIGNKGIAGESGKIRIGTSGTHTNCYIAGALGDTEIDGTLDVTGLLSPDAGIDVNGSNFTVAANGDTAIAGTLDVTGDVAVNTDKFNVTAASGNTDIAGTLNVTGKLTSENFRTIEGIVSLTAVGTGALASNYSSGLRNTAVGFQALNSNVYGDYNTAMGYRALYSSKGNTNTAFGNQALLNCTGAHNIAIGSNAGSNLTDENYNICIGDGVNGSIGEANAMYIGDTSNYKKCYVGGIYGVDPTGIAVEINSNHQLGAPTSSRRFKENINDMSIVAGYDLSKLRPVTFNYISDETNHKQYGLIAEEVVDVYPETVALDEDGQPFAVRYNQFIPILIEGHQLHDAKIEEHDTEIGELRSQVEQLKAVVEGMVNRNA